MGPACRAVWKVLTARTLATPRGLRFLTMPVRRRRGRMEWQPVSLPRMRRMPRPRRLGRMQPRMRRPRPRETRRMASIFPACRKILIHPVFRRNFRGDFPRRLPAGKPKRRPLRIPPRRKTPAPAVLPAAGRRDRMERSAQTGRGLLLPRRKGGFGLELRPPFWL